jgi:SAM-dependent methyltransferase
MRRLPEVYVAGLLISRKRALFERRASDTQCRLARERSFILTVGLRMSQNQTDVVMPSSGAEYYDVNYPDYARQNSPAKLDFYMELLQRYVPAGANVFELGVGMGLFFERASQKYNCRGCDVNEFGVAATSNRVASAALTVGSCETIPPAPAQRAVVAWDVLEHIPDLDQGLQTIFDRLAPDGYLIAVVPVYDGPLGWLVEMLDKDPTHVSKWGRYKWLETLQRHGFDVVEWGGIIRRLVGERYLHFTGPGWLLRPAGSAIYFVAGKPPT